MMDTVTLPARDMHLPFPFKTITLDISISLSITKHTRTSRLVRKPQVLSSFFITNHLAFDTAITVSTVIQYTSLGSGNIAYYFNSSQDYFNISITGFMGSFYLARDLNSTS